MNRIFKFLTTFLLLFLAAFQFSKAALGADYSYKVKEIILDNSDRIVFVKGTGSITKPIKTLTLTNPTRYVVDIEGAVLVGNKRSYKVKNSNTIDNISMAQFSNDPYTVRLVFNLKNEADLKKFKTYANKNDVVVKYANEIIDNSIQYKFYTPNGDMDKTNKLQNTSSVLSFFGQEETFDLVPTLQTKFFLNKINQNSYGIILKGIGSITLERAVYLENSASVTLDNTMVSPKLNGKTYTMPDNKNITLTISKLNEKKVKLTLNAPNNSTQNLKDYRFIISPDGQNLFIANRSFVINTDFAINKSEIASYKFQKNSSNYYIFDFNFTTPVAYNVFEQNDNFYLDVDNLSDYNQMAFEDFLKKSDIKMQAIKISADKTRFVIPMEKLNFAYANVESNSKSIKLCFRAQEIKPLDNPIPTKDTISVIIPSKEPTQAPIPSIQIEKKVEKQGNVEVITKNEQRKTRKSTISSMIKVVIDPGHGGSDSGAISGNTQEKHLNLEVAKMVRDNLEKKNIYVYMTREKDVYLTLDERTVFSNELNPDIFVSIHTNSTLQENSYGLETHYYKDDSLTLAKTIHKHFASEKNLSKWDTKDRGMIKSRFYVINHTEAPSVLIEIGFISNGLEKSKLITKKRQEEIADSITQGILEYLKVK